VYKTYYHGSDKKLSVLKPVGINMGHRWAKPEWAIFFWGSRDNAFKWAVYQWCRRNTSIKTMYHIPSGGFAVVTTAMTELKKLARGQKTYVYRAVLPRLAVGYGSSPDIEEYTYNKDVVPEETEEITITAAVLEQVATVMTEAQFTAYRNDLIAGKYAGGRGFLFRMIMDSERDLLRHKYHKLIAEGKLKPGDPLDNISFEALPAAFRW